ncbi:acyltransferase [Candidatus Gottesmanbacteria bacterium]|nr:acyltransferase [Candidatus Gottesmanbacteria bacterium]
MEALKIIGFRKAFLFIWYWFFCKILRFIPMPQVRVILLGLFGATIGPETIIHECTFSDLYHHGLKNITIGTRCFIGEEVLLDCRGGISLGDNVTISSRACLVTHIAVGYPNHLLMAVYPTKEEKIHIEDNVYIGSAVVILPGIRIGRESVVGAGAVVTKDVAPRTVVAGVPASYKKT